MRQYKTKSDIKMWMHMSDVGCTLLLNEGCDVGRQSVFDTMCIVLHDEYGFGKERLLKLQAEMQTFMNENASMWRDASMGHSSVDSDAGYLRQKFDDALDDIFQRERGSLPFAERYPILTDRL